MKNKKNKKNMFEKILGNFSIERFMPLFKKEFEKNNAKCLLIWFDKNDDMQIKFYEKDLVEVLKEMQKQNLELKETILKIS